MKNHRLCLWLFVLLASALTYTAMSIAGIFAIIRGHEDLALWLYLGGPVFFIVVGIPALYLTHRHFKAYQKEFPIYREKLLRAAREELLELPPT